LELRSGRRESAREHFRAAIVLARNPMERRFLERRVSACEYADARQASILEPGLCWEGEGRS